MLALGTPVVDVFYEADYTFLKKHGLLVGCTNHLSDEKVLAIEKELTPILSMPGDNARNVCEAYMASGGSDCAYIGNIAKDLKGEMIRDNLKTHSIADKMNEVLGKTGRIMCIITPDKHRTFAVYLGVGDSEVKFSNLKAPEIFFCTSITFFANGVGESAFEMAKKFKEGGSKIAISLESPNILEKNVDRIDEILLLADYLFLNLDEMKAIGKTKHGVGGLAKMVFLKLGDKGCSVYNEGRLLGQVKAVEVKEVKDTTGAGDFYAGAVLHSLSHGKNLIETAQAGNLMAARVISKIGAGL